MNVRGPLRVGVGGPVGSGKTALVERLCKRMRDTYDIAVVTNDIYTKEDAEFLTRAGALAPDRIVGVETGGCPHTAIREDASINLAAVADIVRKWPDLEVIFVESGGDNLAATFSPELADLTIYVIDVSAGEKIPRKGGPGITRSDLLVINKIDLAPMVGVGVWASLLAIKRPSAAYLVPAAFIAMMLVGAAAGFAGIKLPLAEAAIVASVLILGALIMAAVRLPSAAAMAVVGLFAVFHGYAHAIEAPTSGTAVYILGFVAATALLHAAGLGLGWVAKRSRGDLALRALGGAVMAGGAFVLIAN